MSIRPVKQLIISKPTLEGAGVHLRRALASETRPNSIHFSSSTISATMYLKIIWRAFPGIPIAASKRLPMFWLGPWSMATVWGTMARSPRATCSG